MSGDKEQLAFNRGVLSFGGLLVASMLASLLMLRCVSAKTVADVQSLAAKDVTCLLQQADLYLNPVDAAAKCAIAVSPDLLPVIEDIVLSREASKKAGVAPALRSVPHEITDAAHETETPIP